MKAIVTSALAAVLVAGAAFAGTPAIEGNYVETRSCDVYVAACFANGEVFATGKEATLAWDITRGIYKGVDLSGMKVIAVVKTDETMGDVTKLADAGKAVFVVDANATAAQHDALVEFATAEAAHLVDEVVAVESLPISFTLGDEPGFAHITAGDVLEIETRCLHAHDKHCGNEVAYYPPLTNVDDAHVAFTETDRYQGDDLGVQWHNSVRSSAYLATFTR